MHASTLRRRLGSALLEFAWEEWAQMGVFAPTRTRRRWAQDPEALLLMTFEVAREDPRLFDEVLDWLLRNESLISVRRLRRMCRDKADERLVRAAFAWVRSQRVSHPLPHVEQSDNVAVEALFPAVDLPAFRVDPSFRAAGFSRSVAEPSGKSRAPDFSAPINFAFRLRQLLGLGARAEAVRYLITAAAEPASVAEVAASSGYAKRNVQEALTALDSAGVIARVGGSNEKRFVIDRSRWAYLLDLETRQLPVYRDWPQLLGALTAILRWLARSDLDELSEYMRSSQAADLLDAVRPQLSRAGILLPARVGGERSWRDLEDTVEYALRWLTPDDEGRGRPAVFEIVPGVPEGYWWRLNTAAGRVIALSAGAYASEAAARAAVDRIRSSLDGLVVRVVADAGVYRWNIVADNGRVLAVSTEGFAAMNDAERAARDARGLMAGAGLSRVMHGVTLNRARRHVTSRGDGSWEVRAEGATRAASVHSSQRDAVKAANVQVRRRGGGEVLVHTRDGRVVESNVVA